LILFLKCEKQFIFEAKPIASTSFFLSKDLRSDLIFIFFKFVIAHIFLGTASNENRALSNFE